MNNAATTLDGQRVVIFGDFLLVRVDPPRTLSQSGLYISRHLRDFEWTEHATVLAVGTGVRDPETGERVPIDTVKVGDRVVFSHLPSREGTWMERRFGSGARIYPLDLIDGIIEEDVIEVHELERNGRCVNGDCPCQVGLDCLGPQEPTTSSFERA
jgi:co-chaperonin GroES (HSP10)